MKGIVIGVWLLSVGVLPAFAQAPPAATPQEEAQARYKVFVMERVLEQAVQNGAAVLTRQVRAISPDAMFLSGGSQVRGFRLDGYGVFFDVEVPALMPTAIWTLRAMIDYNGESLQRLRAYIQKDVPDPRVRAELELALRTIEVQVPGRITPPEPSVSAANLAAGASPAAARQAPPVDKTVLADPGAAYTKAVKDALVDSMLENSAPLAIGNDEWLTIAARDGEPPSRLVPGDAYDLTTTVIRVKGSDLAAYRAGRLTLAEARSRVEIKEF